MPIILARAMSLVWPGAGLERCVVPSGVNVRALACRWAGKEIEQEVIIR